MVPRDSGYLSTHKLCSTQPGDCGYPAPVTPVVTPLCIDKMFAIPTLNAINMVTKVQQLIASSFTQKLPCNLTRCVATLQK